VALALRCAAANVQCAPSRRTDNSVGVQVMTALEALYDSLCMTAEDTVCVKVKCTLELLNDRTVGPLLEGAHCRGLCRHSKQCYRYKRG
jgi:hypothetical protein